MLKHIVFLSPTFSWQNLQYFVLISKVNQFAADATELIRIFSELFEQRRSLLHALLRFNVYPVKGTLARYFGPQVFREKKPTRSPDSSLVFVLDINSVPQRYINICQPEQIENLFLVGIGFSCNHCKHTCSRQGRLELLMLSM